MCQGLYKRLKSWMKDGYKAFCEETSMHGFLELFRAKSTFWRIFWFLAMVGAFAATIYQLRGSFLQFFDQTPITVLEPCSDVEYPPIQFCTKDVLMWLDFDKLADTFEKHNLSYDKSLVAMMSYFFKIETTVDYDDNLTASFLLLDNFLRNQISVEKFLSDHAIFHYTIKAASVYDTLPFVPTFRVIAGSGDVKTYYCLDINGSQVQKALELTGKRQITFDLLIRYVQRVKHGPWDILSRSEMLNKFVYLPADDRDFKCPSCTFEVQSYEAENQETDLNNTELFKFITNLTYRPSEFFMLDGSYSAIKLPSLMIDNEIQYYRYSFLLKPFVQKLISRNGAICEEGQKNMYNDEFCRNYCTYITEYYNYVGDDPSKECIMIYKYLLNSQVSILKNQTNGKNFCRYGVFGPEKIYIYWFGAGTINNSDSIRENCMQICNSPCEKWIWEVSLTQQHSPYAVPGNPGYKVDFIYPSNNSILAFRQVHSRSWEDLVGSVGGLLGIWTGASILSLLQMFYLFCCAPNDLSDNMINNRSNGKIKPKDSRASAKEDITVLHN